MSRLRNILFHLLLRYGNKNLPGDVLEELLVILDQNFLLLQPDLLLDGHGHRPVPIVWEAFGTLDKRVGDKKLAILKLDGFLEEF